MTLAASVSDVTPDCPVVIVGAGLAGARAADFLAQRGRLGGRIVLLGDEDVHPYDRTLVSKDLLVGDVDEARLSLRPASYYATLGVDLRLKSRATALDVDSSSIRTMNGEEIRFARLLIATGARPRRLEIPRDPSVEFHYLRTFADAARLRLNTQVSRRVVMVGAGFIGLEVAAQLRSRGIDVSVVEPMATPLEKLLGPEVGLLVQRLHEKAGVRFHLSSSVTAVERYGESYVVRTDNGEELGTDLIVVGIGVEPATEWLKNSGVRLADGVVVDQYCATNIDHVFAAGDIARWIHPRFGSMRVEHETNAANQGIVAAKNLLGKKTDYRSVPYVWSKQYQHRLEYIGHAADWDDVSVESSPDGTSSVARYARAGQLMGVFVIDRPEEVPAARVALSAEG